jgi:type I restriction enzyme M protein
MLDTETRRRIDAARDILVGKVPDPKSQVEQITIALVYKFMDDMDQESISMGGKASFFTGDYAKYAWSAVFDPRLGGHEMLALYADAITKMSLNPNLPQLFRDIFRNAFLPYRDPETLKLFLKTINDFAYDHSERLGDAFEYLLSVLGSQGDAGQFRTPRHIIDFMVSVIRPRKTESVLDPACGTAGFLISAYKYILAQNGKTHPGDLLLTEDRQRLMDNFKGYDISPDMVRLSRVNLYLHNFVQPKIYEYDTLTSEERWNEFADVILANPPFMSPKGGIKPHKRFSVQSNRSEVLFVNYMAEHLTPNGRAAIIVPEGIIFQSSGAYKQLRKQLVEKDYLWAVVSLPSGVFNPYAGVKTSILFLDRLLAKKTDKVLFLRIENDGFDLGSQRRSIEKNDLPSIYKTLTSWMTAIGTGNYQNILFDDSVIIASKTQIANNGEFNLFGERYRNIKVSSEKMGMISLRDLLEDSGEKVGGSSDIPVMSITMNFGLIDQEEKFNKRIASQNITNYKKVYQNELVVGFPIDEGVIGFQTKYEAAAVSPAYNIWKLKRSDLDIGFIETVLRSIQARSIYKQRMQGSVNRRRVIPKEEFLNIQIPFPSLETQLEIMEEISGYRRIIDGARQVVENWRPDIQSALEKLLPKEMDEWVTAPIGSCSKFYSGGTPSKSNPDFWEGSIPWVSPKDMKETYLFDAIDHISEAAIKNSATKTVPENTILVVNRSGILAHSFPVALARREVAFNQDINAIVCDLGKLNPEYLLNYLLSSEKIIVSTGVKRGGTVHSLYSNFLSELSIPVPPLDVQNSIVASIENERQIVDANRELIRIYEQKIQRAIARVWGE